MPKWSSPLFSDIRNALGESVVFSMWKGRPYFRSWVRPANPKTMKQTANRALMDRLVERYQTVMSSDDIKAVWTARALPYTISGFNVFIKFGMLSSISCPASGDTITPVTITYTTGVPAADAAIYAYDGSAWEDITPAGGLEAGADQTFDHTFDTANTYTLYVADTVPLVDGDSAPKAYQAINPYERDEATGTASLAEIVISGA